MIDDQIVALSLMMPERVKKAIRRAENNDDMLRIMQAEVRRLFLNPTLGEEQFITLMVESMIKNMLKKSDLFESYIEYKDFARRHNAKRKG